MHRHRIRGTGVREEKRRKKGTKDSLSRPLSLEVESHEERENVSGETSARSRRTREGGEGRGREREMLTAREGDRKTREGASLRVYVSAYVRLPVYASRRRGSVCLLLLLLCCCASRAIQRRGPSASRDLTRLDSTRSLPLADSIDCCCSCEPRVRAISLSPALVVVAVCSCSLPLTSVAETD